MAAISLIFYFPLFLAMYIIFNHFQNKLRNLPPSPFPSLPIIGHLHLLRRPLHRCLSQISAKHGPLVLLQFGLRNVLLVSSPALAQDCFTTTNDVVFANRPRMAAGRRLAYNCTTLAWAPYGDHWRNLRRIASTQLLSSQRVQSLSGIRAGEVKSMIRWLLGKREEEVDMKVALFELTLNVVMSMIAGKRYYGDNVSDAEEARRFREIQTETMRLSGETNLEDFLPWLRSKELERRMRGCHGKRDGFFQELIEEWRGKKKESSSDDHLQRKCLIQVLLSSQLTDPDYYTDDLIKGMIMVLLSAGTETSSNTVEWALSLLLNHPPALKAAQSEIDTLVGKDRLVEETDLGKLHYLEGIIKETMRMYPALPLLVPHESSEECVVGGYKVPSGTILLVNTWDIHNDTRIWDDPSEFKPERFVEGGQGRGDNYDDDGFKFLAFGYGRRSCPGEGLGMKMVSLTLATLIQCFDWEIPGNRAMVDMSEQTGFTMAKALPLKVKPRPRDAMLNLLSQI
ncbi:Isoflavone 2'-hydroxylase [Linum grandiflorum]